MIEVRQVTKRFVDREVLKDITFSVDKGQIVGFLGPNGAGKTTTLRIITGYLPATSGRVTVDGLDVFSDSVAVRRRVGYLPENVPLYPEMRVIEYLRYRAALKNVPPAKRAKDIDSAMERLRIGDVAGRIIGQLSKGYRQRVGISDALLGSPPILILDEPTVGLDPNQIRETRSLIRELGKDHTILLSTHILPEVEAVASRVAIVHKGRVVAEGRPDELKQRLGYRDGATAATAKVLLSVEARGSKAAIEESLGKLGGVHGAIEVAGLGEDVHKVTLSMDGVESGAAREAVFGAAVSGGWVLRGLAAQTVSLEDVFASLTMVEPEAETEPKEAKPAAPPPPSPEEARP
jgi:ABC-2 type transport system ATP-binding protein